MTLRGFSRVWLTLQRSISVSVLLLRTHIVLTRHVFPLIVPQKDEEKGGDRSYNNAKAFVDFPATQDARKVLDMHHLLPFQFDGRELLMNFCDTSQPQGRKAEPNSTLYVAGLPAGATVEDVTQAFKSYKHVFQSARLRKLQSLVVK